MSCNGCRVLRKGCSQQCVLRPSLEWIDGAEAQGHATVFLAKFFGRAGLMSFISAIPEKQRPALFKSLLYEACGRTVNPVFGAMGLLLSGNWQVCHAAVEMVLRNGFISIHSSEATAATTLQTPTSNSSLQVQSTSPPAVTNYGDNIDLDLSLGSKFNPSFWQKYSTEASDPSHFPFCNILSSNGTPLKSLELPVSCKPTPMENSQHFELLRHINQNNPPCSIADMRTNI